MPDQVNAYCAGTSVASLCWFWHARPRGEFKSRLRSSGSPGDLGPAYAKNAGWNYEK